MPREPWNTAKHIAIIAIILWYANLIFPFKTRVPSIADAATRDNVVIPR